MDINVPLLDLAVERAIRPFLIVQGNLDNPSIEGYHHQQVIPKARAWLTKDSINANPRGSLEGALKAHKNLLSQFQSMKSAKFLADADPDAIRRNAMDLLHGTDPPLARINRFFEWSKVQVTGPAEKAGMDPTVISYLLAMSDPTKYAFCKPEVFKDAAMHLLSGPPVKDRLERLVQATEFYRSALELFQNRYRLPFTDLQHVHIAFWVIHNRSAGVGWSELSPESPSKVVPMSKHDLNLILYGPPGTGKTYDTIRRAVEICDGTAPAKHEQSIERFHKLREEKRLEFVTFHQAYGYEDFVEGLRPVLQENEPEQERDAIGDVRYECRPGVFKRLCLLAGISSTTSEGDSDVNWGNVRIWKMSLGNVNDPEEAGIFDDCIANHYLLLGYGGNLNFEDCNSRQEIEEKLKPKIAEVPGGDYTPYSPQAVDALKLQMQVGDLVVVSDGNRRFRAIARVTGPYRFLKKEGYQQMRPVEWLVVLNESLPRETIYDKAFSQMTLYRLRNKDIKLDALRELISRPKGEQRNFVLIIDEINRGNIAKILGELITLLEEDKRLGAKNEMKVSLPYSGHQFGVPSNVYVIGTMNTADRSIAFLDVALRRRFRFVEMMPDPEVIRDVVGGQGTIDGVDIPDLLQAINKRIELLYDRDHQIGHSFFLDVKSLSDLRDVFCEKVIPLLQEYFYGDWSKICLVLGCPVTDGERVVQTNSQPLILAESLKAVNLLAGADESIEDKLSCSVNPAFANSKSSDELRTMFTAVAGKANAK